jgi:hypothetical protein
MMKNFPFLSHSQHCLKKSPNSLLLINVCPNINFWRYFIHYACSAALKSVCQILNFSLNSSKINPPAVMRLTFDPEWLAITRAFHPFMSTTLVQPLPDESQVRQLIKKELEWIQQNIEKQDSMDGLVDIPVCQQFTMTASGPGEEGDNVHQQCVLSLPIILHVFTLYYSTLFFKSTDRSLLSHARTGEQG